MTQQVNGTKAGLSSGLAVLAALATLGGLWPSSTFAQTRPAIVKNVDEPGRTPWVTRSQVLPNAGGQALGGAVCDGLSGQRRRPDDPHRTRQPSGGIVFDGTRWSHGGPFVRVVGRPNLAGYSVIVFNGYLMDAT